MRTAVEMQGSATEAAVAVAVHVVNTPNSDAREAYEAAFRRIEEQGLFPPVGQRGHTVWLVGDVLHVLDVWDSVDNMKAFMEKLAPILDEFGVQLAGEPEVGEIIHVARQSWIQPTSPRTAQLRSLAQAPRHGDPPRWGRLSAERHRALGDVVTLCVPVWWVDDRRTDPQVTRKRSLGTLYHER